MSPSSYPHRSIDSYGRRSICGEWSSVGYWEQNDQGRTAGCVSRGCADITCRCLCALADLNDELNTEWMPDLEKHYQWTAETDPDHPTWAVLYEAPQLRQYLRTFDVVGTDPCASRAATLKRKDPFPQPWTRRVASGVLM